MFIPLSIAAKNEPDGLAKSCTHKCDTLFGLKLGGQGRLTGFSNCNWDCESDQWNFIHLANGQRVKTGMKWQCVEYARRWMNVELSHTFTSIDHAYQIWDLESAHELGTQKEVKWLKFANGQTREKPQRSDLLIYNKTVGIHGHVAVVVDERDGYVLIAEQNFSNKQWEQKAYARKAKLVKNPQGNYSLSDEGLIGWMRIPQSPQSPLTSNVQFKMEN